MGTEEWLRQQYSDTLEDAKMFRAAYLERFQLYAISVYLMQQMETKEIVLDMTDFNASNKYILVMKPTGEGKETKCSFSLMENTNPEKNGVI